MKIKTNMKYEVAAMGELLIDFTQNGLSTQGNWLCEANPGGAPCNVLAMLRKLNHKTAFIGKVGNDMFGTMLKERVTNLGIDVTNLIMSDAYKTTLAFVHTAPDGDRSFSFYRNPGADAALEKSEISDTLISSSAILHYGTLSMTNEPVNTATEYALETAEKSGTLLSFDPNLRPPLWDTPDHAKERILFGISRCNILKIAEEELSFCTGEEDIVNGIVKLRTKYTIPLITVTQGKHGCRAFYDNGRTTLDMQCPTFTSVKTIDTTGAGDTFCACILHDILKNGYDDFTKDRLHDMLVFANAASSLITTRKGALSVMPSEADVKSLITGNV
ncbi:MAG: carbohydrate kinase [Treponema sp.]|nr:carbohydrate kinase [Treponema sp.]